MGLQHRHDEGGGGPHDDNALQIEDVPNRKQESSIIKFYQPTTSIRVHSSITVQLAVHVQQEKISRVRNYISNQEEDIKSLRNMVVIYEPEYDH